MESLQRTAGSLPPLVAAAVLVVLAMWAFARFHRLGVVRELGEKRNVAAAVLLAGNQVALVTALAGVMWGLVVVLMGASAVLHGRVLFRAFDVRSEVAGDRNLGAAFCMAGSLVASGLVLNGAATGVSVGLVVRGAIAGRSVEGLGGELAGRSAWSTPTST